MTRDARIDSRFLLGLLLYFSLFAVVRVLISDALELDEAEQLLLAQWWQWGYSAQPPLYTWLSAGAERLFGVNLLTASLLREALLFLTYLFVYLTALRVLQGPRLAIAATLSLLLIPQILWENQREHTHSLLALCLAAATLYLVILLLQRRHLATYLALGLVGGLGVLAKYNILLFDFALAAALLTLAEGRRLLLDWRCAIALGLALLILSPHLFWLLQHLQAISDLHAVVAGEARRVSASLQVLVTVLVFLTPMWLVFTLMFYPALREGLHAGVRGVAVQLILRYLAVVLALLLCAQWVLGMGQIKERWLQPLLFMVPIACFALLNAQAVRRRRLNLYSGIALTAGALALLVTAVRLPLLSDASKPSRLHQPIAELAALIAPLAPPGSLLLAEEYALAGALRLHLPDRVWYGPRMSYVVPPIPQLVQDAKQVVLLWDGARQESVPPQLRHLAEDAGLRLEGAVPGYIEAPYRYGLARHYRLGMLVVPGPALETSVFQADPDR